MAKFVRTIAGAALIGTGLFLEFVTIGASTPLTAFLISSGVGMVLSGIGTMLAKGPMAGTSTASRNAIAPWNVVYGRAKIGGALIYFGEFGDNDKYLDMVFVLACHQSKSVDALLFDSQRIQISTNAGPFNGVSGDSFTPVQQNIPISHISRANNVVTVVLLQDIPLLQAGDNVIVQNVSGDYTLNGKFPVEQIISQVYARAVGVALEDVLDATEELLSGCDCPQSCYRCIRHYRNNYIHASLDRHLALALLRHVRYSTNPSVSVPERTSASVGLREYLQLRGIQQESGVQADGVEVPMIIRAGGREVWVDFHHALINPEASPSNVALKARAAFKELVEVDVFTLAHDLPSAISRFRFQHGQCS